MTTSYARVRPGLEEASTYANSRAAVHRNCISLRAETMGSGGMIAG